MWCLDESAPFENGNAFEILHVEGTCLAHQALLLPLFQLGLHTCRLRLFAGLLDAILGLADVLIQIDDRPGPDCLYLFLLLCRAST